MKHKHTFEHLKHITMHAVARKKIQYFLVLLDETSEVLENLKELIPR